MGFCMESARIMLIIFNFIFWLSGVALLGVGIWFLVDPNIAHYLEVVNFDIEGNALKYSAYILIAFGAFIFLVGFTGCCGAIRKSKCLIGFYLMFLVIVFAGELAAGIIVAIYRNEIEARVDKSLMKSLKTEYKFANESSITNSWDIIQKELKCCGAEGYKDYENSLFTNTTMHIVPLSCCIMENDVPKDAAKCQMATNTYYHEKGCKGGLIDWVKSHSVILIGIGCGLAGLQIIGFIFAVCLCRSFNLEEK
ncbi:tetraspanin-18 [Patella vulgata]|uniref:tetraspanin-18 n=1 Tax=Patella vulgata TaxID=6465 RepID=UPI0021804CDD|nr:tetraspanin-18 [Patella vulgata]XP_050409935.1 tetraspanin-18 [Patella vulgata]XP_050409936.1 tetraspanin-18 [Patella vulgata]XP_050409937.1 tetraspanin-18 [Patella vulgata]XP_050409938.1 tetraspanin-18 [Patella vulgata]XP_050409939.1 tetraspanin-18 [Patella vulgata]XP_050409940.1 tetraspanin-18 [Patella vulgata]XP_055957581.1 tetraspanin-18 [Patella vulgata]